MGATVIVGYARELDSPDFSGSLGADSCKNWAKLRKDVEKSSDYRPRFVEELVLQQT